MGTHEQWGAIDAEELYEVPRWGKGYFSVGDAGHVLVHPTKDTAQSIDLKQLADDLQTRGIDLPVLIRFSDILKHRLGDIHDAFQAAIAQHSYTGRYTCVYPIKVNQQRQVVEEVLSFGRPYNFGLEAGSKPELLAVMAMATNGTPIICNGFKDAEYIETAMLAQKIGRTIIPVVEKYTELELILHYAEKVGVRQVAVVRGLPLEVRADGRGDPAGAGAPEGARDAGLLQAPALSPRQPDSQHPDREGGAERSRPRLHGAGARRRGARVPGRRRRPGRGL
jgi:arginine decarboxylase